jgi:hypothetical protein
MENAEWSPAATPDGRDKIVFSVYDSVLNLYGVHVINPDGSGLQTLASGVDAFNVAWNHYADALLVVKADTDWGALYLQHLAALGGGGLFITGETLLDPPTEQIVDPCAANTTNRVVYSSWPSSGSSGLEVLDLGVSPPAATQITFRDDYWPSSSPDDARLAYARRSPSTGRYDIYTALADGAGEVLIRSSTNNVSLMYPNWRHN